MYNALIWVGLFILLFAGQMLVKVILPIRRWKYLRQQGQRAIAAMQFEEAERLSRQALAIVEKQKFGDAMAAESSMGIGDALLMRGQYLEAVEWLRKALNLAGSGFAKRPEVTIRYRTSLAGVLGLFGQYAEVETLLDQALYLAREAGLYDDSQTLLARNHMASLLRETGRFAEAEMMLREMQATCEQNPGKVRQSIMGMACNGLAAIHLARHEDDRAEELARQGEEIYRQFFGERHPFLIMPLQLLARLRLLRGRYAEAEELCMTGLHYVDERPEAGDTLKIDLQQPLAEVYVHTQRLDEAGATLDRVRASIVERFGEDAIYLNRTRMSESLLLQARGQYAEAEAALLAVRAKLAEAGAPRGFTTTELLPRLAALYTAMGQPNKAAVINAEALTLGREILGPDCPYVREMEEKVRAIG